MSSVSYKDSGFQVPKLTSENWHQWQIDAKAYLRMKKLWRIVDNPPAGKSEEQLESDEQALGLITLFCGINGKNLVADCNTAAEAWSKLQDRYQSTAVESQSLIRTQYDSLRCTSGKDIPTYCNDFRSMYQRMRAVGIEESEQAVAQKMVLLLPNEYQWILKTNDKPKYDLLDWAITKVLTEHELQRTRAMLNNTSMSQDQEKVFAVAKTGDFRRNSKTVRCWNCGEQGHIKGQCRNQPKTITTGLKKGNIHQIRLMLEPSCVGQQAMLKGHGRQVVFGLTREQRVICLETLNCSRAQRL